MTKYEIDLPLKIPLPIPVQIVISLGKEDGVFLKYGTQEVSMASMPSGWTSSPKHLKNLELFIQTQLNYFHIPCLFVEKNGNELTISNLSQKIGLYVSEKKKELEQQESSDVEAKEVINYIQDPLTIDDVVQAFKKWLYIADKDVIHLVCAVAHSQRMAGDPVWLMLVAPPSSSKSEIIRSLGDKPNEMVYPVSEFTGASLASGHKHDGKDLLAKFDENIVTVKDFTTLFTGHEDERNRVFAVLREAFDGYYKKEFGGEVVEKAFHIHTTIIGGVTNIIDEHKIFLASLGDRFLESRIRNDEAEVGRKASQIEGKEKEMRAELKLTMLSYLHQLSVVDVTIPDEKREQIVIIARFLAKMRTGVSRSGKIIGYYPDPEMPGRIAKQLVKLAKALAQVRGRNEVNGEDITTVKRVVIDSCPEMRVRILSSLIEKHFPPAPSFQNTDEKTWIDNPPWFEAIRLNSDLIADSIHLNLATTNMHLEDMSMLQILDVTKHLVDSIYQEATESEDEDETPNSNNLAPAPKTKPTKKLSFVYKISDSFFDLFGQMMGEIIEWNYSIKKIEDENAGKNQ